MYVFENMCKGKASTVRETAYHFIVAAGDNSAEGTLGHLSNTLRRFGNKGRFTTKVPARKNVETLL